MAGEPIQLVASILPAGPGRLTWRIVDQGYNIQPACSSAHCHASGHVSFPVEAGRRATNSAYADARAAILRAARALRPLRQAGVVAHKAACDGRTGLRLSSVGVHYTVNLSGTVSLSQIREGLT